MTDRHTTTDTTPALTPEREAEIRKRVTDPCRHAAAIALHAGEDVRVLLAELDRVRAERDQLDANLLRAEEVGARTRERHDRERQEMAARVAELEQQAAAQRAAALTEAEQHLRGLARHLDSGTGFYSGVDWAADKTAALNTTAQPAS